MRRTTERVHTRNGERARKGSAMKRTILLVSAAALLAGTTYASAQVRDDPPGWAWQRRGILEDQGRNPQRFGYYGGEHQSYGAYCVYPYFRYPRFGYVPGPRSFFFLRGDHPPPPPQTIAGVE